MARILVVDDETELRLAVRIALRIRDHDVLLAGSGEEALDLLEREKADVLLLDLRLPGIDGWEVLDRLRAEGRLDGMRVILFTAQSEPDQTERARAAGCAAVVPKPFGLDELIEAVEGASGG